MVTWSARRGQAHRAAAGHINKMPAPRADTQNTPNNNIWSRAPSENRAHHTRNMGHAEPGDSHGTDGHMLLVHIFISYATSKLRAKRTPGGFARRSTRIVPPIKLL